MSEIFRFTCLLCILGDPSDAIACIDSVFGRRKNAPSLGLSMVPSWYMLPSLRNSGDRYDPNRHNLLELLDPSWHISCL